MHEENKGLENTYDNATGKFKCEYCGTIFFTCHNSDVMCPECWKYPSNMQTEID